MPRRSNKTARLRAPRESEQHNRLKLTCTTQLTWLCSGRHLKLLHKNPAKKKRASTLSYDHLWQRTRHWSSTLFRPSRLPLHFADATEAERVGTHSAVPSVQCVCGTGCWWRWSFTMPKHWRNGNTSSLAQRQRSRRCGSSNISPRHRPCIGLTSPRHDSSEARLQPEWDGLACWNGDMCS